MRKLRGAAAGGGERLGVLAFEAAALMSRAAGLWRALGDAPLARLRREAVRLEGVRRLVADDDAALLALAVAELAAACGGLARAVARLAAARCADPLLRRFGALFAALVGGADRHGLRYAAAGKMDRKARKMQRLVASTARLCHELDVLADLERGLRRRGGGEEAARHLARQRREVERLRAASLWDRSFDYAVRLLARSLFTIVARIVEVFDLEPMTTSNPIHDSDSHSDSGLSRLSWSTSFVMNSTQSMVYPSDVTADAAQRMQRAKSGKLTTSGDARRSLMPRSKSLKQQLIGCVVATGSKSPVRENRIHGAGDLPLSFSYVSSATKDDHSGTNPQLQADDPHANAKLTTSVFESSRDALTTSAPETSLGAAALAPRYAGLIILIEKLAVAPHRIRSDERDGLYGMLTDTIRASLRPRLVGPSAKRRPRECDPALAAAEWAGTVRGILGWLAPLAHNTMRWQAERSFEQRDVASSASVVVLLLQTLHFADREKTEAALTELLVGLNYLWRSGRELEERARLESAASGNHEDDTEYGA